MEQKYNPGCLGQARLPDKDIHDLCHQLKTEVEEKINKKFDKFLAICYRSQVVAGINYFIKVDVGNDWCVHLKVFDPLPYKSGNLSLAGVQEGKRHGDEIVSF